MDFDHKIPIYLQVIHDIKRQLIRATLPLGEKMPSARELAVKYQINPNTANRIYKELEAEELCFTKRGLGTYITENEEKIALIRGEMAEEFLSAFLEGMKGLGYTQKELIELIEKNYE